MLVFLVAPRVFRAPEAPAAREARRPHFVRRRASKPARALRALRRPPHLWGWGADRRVVSKPGQAPPPPARLGNLASLGAASRSPARPRRRPPAPRQIPPAPSTPVVPGRCFLVRCVVSMPGQAPPPPTGTAARPSGPSGAFQPLQSTGAGQGIAQNADHFGENA